MSTYCNLLQPALRNLLHTACCSVLPHEMVMYDAHIGGRFWRTKITRKASDAAENLQSSCLVLPSEIVMHDNAYIGGRSENNINASCMTISGGRTKQLDIFCHVTGFTSDFLKFHSCGSNSVLSQSHAICSSLNDSLVQRR